jgi:hypothetical protein
VAWHFAYELLIEPAAFRECYPADSKGHRHATAILNYTETGGALWKHESFNEDQLFDWLWVGGVGERVKGPVPLQRQQFGGAHLWKHIEAMAQAQKRRDQAHPT